MTTAATATTIAKTKSTTAAKVAPAQNDKDGYKEEIASLMPEEDCSDWLGF